jgi:hypothetical protein
VFGVVQDEQAGDASQGLDHCFEGVLVGGERELEGGGEGEGDEVGVGKGGQLDKPDAAVEGGGDLASDLDRQAGLAGPARSGESEEAGFGMRQAAGEIGDLRLPPEEAGQLQG